jgi:phosphoglycerate dehydrogenase-like enzyme
VKIGYLGKLDSFSVEMLKELEAGNTQDEFLTWQPGEKPPAMDLEVLLVMGEAGAAELEGQTKLGLLQTASAGYDGVDVQAATEAGIWVASAPTTETGNGESVAEWAVLLMLAASRQLNEALAFTRNASPDRPQKPEKNMALYGKTVCVVGLDGIGDLLVERLRGFGMVLTGVDNHAEHPPAEMKVYRQEELKIALPLADYVVLAIPGTKQNENLIDADMLASMKKGAVLLNVSRGILIDEPALLASLKSGHLFGAGLDVVKNEPVKPGDPLMSDQRIFITPHIAGSTDIMLGGTVNYLRDVLTGYANGVRPEGVVNEPSEPRVPLRIQGLQPRAYS